MRPSGRPTASGSRSATRTAGCSSSRSTTRSSTEIAHSTPGAIATTAGRRAATHLAFSINNPNGFGSIYIWSASDGKTAPRHRASISIRQSPAWDPDGQLPVLPQRPRVRAADLAASSSIRDQPQTDIYAMALRKDVKNPFPPESDEVEPIAKDDDAKEDDTKKDEKKDEKPKDLVDRLRRHRERASPRSRSRARTTAASPPRAGYLIYSVDPALRTTAATADTKARSRIYSLKDRKETTLMEDAGGFDALARRLEAAGPRGQRLHAHGRDARRAPPPRRPCRPRTCMSTACPRRSGPRSSTRSGGGIATSSTRRTCTATTGRRCASSTSRCSSTSRTART